MLGYGDKVTDGKRTGIVTWVGKTLIRVRVDGSTPSALRKRPALLRQMSDWKKITASRSE